jgi:OmpA-OmpF porin, OOP family
MQNIFWPLLLFIIIINNGVKAQNLLPNGDFKEQQICVEFEQKCAPMGWRLTSIDPPTYYRQFEGTDTSAHVAWATFVALSLTEKLYREYLQAPLLCPLIKGEKYRFSISLRPEMFAIKEFGVKFCDTSTITGVNILLMETPDIVFSDKNYLYKKKNEWMTLTYDYTANGTERYILIGNFKADEDTEYKSVKALKISMKIAYYVKNVSLTAVRDIPVCDYSELIKRLRNDRHRHTLFSLQFFQDTLAIQATKPKKNKPMATKPRIDSTIVIPLLPIIYFDTDKYTLREKFTKDLLAVVAYLQKFPEVNLTISGHTDNAGTDKYNEVLSDKRAKTVHEFFISHGISSHRITVNSFGEKNPVSNNLTEEGKQLNRRAELRFLTIQNID